MSYTASYRRSALVLPAILLALVLFIMLMVWALTSGADTETIALIIVGGAGVTILVTIIVMLTGLRIHHWVIESGGLRIEERPKVRFTGFTARAFVPWSEVVALRRIESGFEQLIEIEVRDGASYRMAPAIASGPHAKGYTDEVGLDALATAISTRLVAAGAATSQVREGLSLWNRLPGLAILCSAFVASVMIAAAAAIAIWSGAYLYGAVLKASALILILPLGAGYLLFKSIKRRLRILNGHSGHPAPARS